MRDLIDIIAEAMRPHLVYHSTEWGAEILASGHIQANSTIDLGARSTKATDLRHDSEHHEAKGVCVTRSFRFATQFSDVIFGIDIDSLRHSFKIMPRAESGAYDLADDHGDFRIEAEEFIICPGIDLSRYLVAIWVSEQFRDNPEYADLINDERFVDFFRQP